MSKVEVERPNDRVAIVRLNRPERLKALDDELAVSGPRTPQAIVSQFTLLQGARVPKGHEHARRFVDPRGFEIFTCQFSEVSGIPALLRLLLAAIIWFPRLQY
jgi:hypothetical protein